MTDPIQLRVVLDTNQIIEAGSKWVDPLLELPTSPARSLIKAVARDHLGLYSDQVMAEYIKKLHEKGHPKKRISELIGLLIGSFDFILVTTTDCNPKPVDPDDIVFLLCALDGDADLLVSNDKHLLDLKSSYVKPEVVNQVDAITRLLE